jgi:DNA-binding GntR family transcriptional regulator
LSIILEAAMLSSELTGLAGTLASSVYERIREDILIGRLQPGEKLRIDTLRQRYTVGGSPIREALNRLSSEGLVLQHDQRGFGVLPASIEDLVELTRTRCQINEIMLRESLSHGDSKWEENVVLAHHRLSRTARYLKELPETPNPEWEKHHSLFHSSLVAACGSRWLINFSEFLFDLGDRYRHLVASFNRADRDSEAEHRMIFDAVIDRDVTAATHLLNVHITATCEQVRKYGLSHARSLDPEPAS